MFYASHISFSEKELSCFHVIHCNPMKASFHLNKQTDLSLSKIDIMSICVEILTNIYNKLL
jgi:hypothetical protein